MLILGGGSAHRILINAHKNEMEMQVVTFSHFAYVVQISKILVILVIVLIILLLAVRIKLFFVRVIWINRVVHRLVGRKYRDVFIEPHVSLHIPCHVD